MIKIILSIFLLSSAYAESAFPDLADKFSSLKRLRLNNGILKSEGLPSEITTINNLLEGHTSIVSRTNYATPDERVQVLGGIAQNEIIAAAINVPEHSYNISPTTPKHKQEHLAALAVMTQGVRAFIHNPLACQDYNTLLNYISQSALAQQQHIKRFLTITAIKVLFPQGFFEHMATYALNMQDYAPQDSLKLGLAFIYDNQPLSYEQGFNIPEKEKWLFEIESKGAFSSLKGWRLSAPSKSQELFYTLYFRPLSSPSDEETLNQIFPRQVMGGYRILFKQEEGKKEGSYRLEEALLHLYTKHFIEDPFEKDPSREVYFFHYEEDRVIPLYVKMINYRGTDSSFENLLKAGVITYSSLNEALKSVPIFLTNPRLSKLSHIINALNPSFLNEQININLFSQKLAHFFKIEEGKLAITDHTINQIALVQRGCYEVLQKETQKVAIENFKKIGRISFTTEWIDNLNKFCQLIKVERYREIDFLRPLCSKLSNLNLPRSDSEKHFIESLENLGGNFEDNLFHYLLSIGFLKVTANLFPTNRSFNINTPEGLRNRIDLLNARLLNPGLSYSYPVKSLANFSFNPYFPIWGHESNKIEFGVCPISTVIEWYSKKGPTHLVWQMYKQVYAYKLFFSNEENKKKYTYTYDDAERLAKDLISNNSFGPLGKPINTLLADMDVEAVG